MTTNAKLSPTLLGFYNLHHSKISKCTYCVSFRCGIPVKRFRYNSYQNGIITLLASFSYLLSIHLWPTVDLFGLTQPVPAGWGGLVGGLQLFFGSRVRFGFKSCGLGWIRVVALWVGYGLFDKIWVLYIYIDIF